MASQWLEMGGDPAEDSREFKGPSNGKMEKMGEDISSITPKKGLILVLIGEGNITIGSLHLMVLRCYTHQCAKGLHSLMRALI